MLFITAGMGGGTGTGAAPVIARVAKEMGILTVGVVTKPFDWEGGRRMTNADQGLAELEANVDSLIVVLNEKLLEVLGDDITQDEAFAHANDVLKNAVGGIAEIINEYGNVNVDFEDVRTVMGEPGKAMMGTAVASGPDRARIAAEQAVACPLLEGIDLSGAKGVLVLVTAAKGSLKLSESKLAMNTIRAYASPDAHVIYGAAYDDSLGEDMRVTVVATGLSPPGCPPQRAAPAGAAHRHRQRAVRRQPGPCSGFAGGCRTARLPVHGRAQCLAHQPHPGRGQGRCTGIRRHGRLRDPGLPAQAGGLTEDSPLRRCAASPLRGAPAALRGGTATRAGVAGPLSPLEGSQSAMMKLLQWLP
jgi:cell division GTPase FtsZ